MFLNIPSANLGALYVIQIDGLADAEKVMRLVDMLEDLDDVQNVYTNADFSEEVMQQLV